MERVVDEGAIHRHEEFAEQFVWAAGATLALAVLILVFRQRSALRALMAAVVLATLAVAGLGLRVGHAGGQLVYVHGAASAYTPASANPASPSGATAQDRRDEDRDEDDDRLK